MLTNICQLNVMLWKAHQSSLGNWVVEKWATSQEKDNLSKKIFLCGENINLLSIYWGLKIVKEYSHTIVCHYNYGAKLMIKKEP